LNKLKSDYHASQIFFTPAPMFSFLLQKTEVKHNMNWIRFVSCILGETDEGCSACKRTYWFLSSRFQGVLGNSSILLW